MENVVIILGTASVVALRAFSFAGAMHMLWDTFGEHAADLAGKLKR
jgi:hypothetical protein